MGLIAFFAIIVCIVVAIIIMAHIRRLKGVYIYDYQVGLLYEAGGRCEILKPGKHSFIVGKDPITIVDMRPYQFVIEQQPFKDRLHTASLLSVAGELFVCDPELAVRMQKRVFDDSFAMVRENLGLTASRFIADASAGGRQDLAAQISSELNKEFQERGLEIRNFVITELWSRPNANSIPAAAN
jgi:hypothetical protein